MGASATSSAFASAGATAQSSAIATANAYASANAVAIANASADGGNIGKAISSASANANANPLGGSYDLQSSDAESIKRQDGTPPAWGHSTANPGVDDLDADSGNREELKRGHDHSHCGIKGHVGSLEEPSMNSEKESKPKRPHPFPPPAHREDDDLAGDSQQSVDIDSGFIGKPEKPSLGGSNGPCAPGDVKCVGNKPSPPTKPRPGMCAPGTPGCPINKPNILNTHSTNPENPDLSGESQYPQNPTGSYGGYPAKPLGPLPCIPAPGTHRCSINEPSVSNPQTTNYENSDLSGDSKHPETSTGGYGSHPTKPGLRPCIPAPGTLGCPRNEPSISNPNPNPHENPDMPGDSQHPEIPDGGYGGHSAEPGPRPCIPAPGTIGCPTNKPIVFNPHPTYHANPDLSGASKPPIKLNGGYGESSPNKQNEAGLCVSDSSGCSTDKSSASNPHPSSHHPGSGETDYPGHNQGSNPSSPNPFLNGEIDVTDIKNSTNPDLSEGLQHPIRNDGGYGGNGSIKPNGAGPCISGSSGCSTDKSNPSNPHPSSHHPGSGDTDYSGHNQATNPSSTNPFLNGQIDVTGIKHPTNPGETPQTNPLNPFLNPHNQRPSMESKPPDTANGNHESSTPSELPHGSSSSGPDYSDHKPNPSNPFFGSNPVQKPGNINAAAQGTKLPITVTPTYSNGPTKPSCHDTNSCFPNNPSGHPNIPAEYPHKDSYDDSEPPVNQPNPLNPFLHPHGPQDVTTGIAGYYPGLPGDVDHKSNTNPKGHEGPQYVLPNDCLGLNTCSPRPPPPTPKRPTAGTPTENPITTNHHHQVNLQPHSINSGENADGPHGPVQGSDEQPDTKPGNLNPFLVDGQLNKPHSKSGSHGSAEGCRNGFSSSGKCHEEDLGDSDVQNSVTDEQWSEIPTSTVDYGVKGHRPGVKGGSHRRGPPGKLVTSPKFEHHGHFDSEPADSFAQASASAGAYSNAHASSSSSNEGNVV